MRFPQPVKRGPASVWRLSDLLAWEAHMDGRPIPDPLPHDQERYLNVRNVARRYDKSTSTIWRWCSDSPSRVAA